MQTLSNVLEMPIKVVRSEQTCALGAAMFACCCRRCYMRRWKKPCDNMGSGFEKEYLPDNSKTDIYRKLYQKVSESGKIC